MDTGEGRTAPPPPRVALRHPGDTPASPEERIHGIEKNDGASQGERARENQPYDGDDGDDGSLLECDEQSLGEEPAALPRAGELPVARISDGGESPRGLPLPHYVLQEADIPSSRLLLFNVETVNENDADDERRASSLAASTNPSCGFTQLMPLVLRTLGRLRWGRAPPRRYVYRDISPGYDVCYMLVGRANFYRTFFIF